jgi:beta-galactosidase GanA
MIINLKNIFTTVLLCCVLQSNAQYNNSGVELKKEKDFSQLLINGKPFLMLGGELGNSSASNIDYLKPSWKYLQQMHLNTVLVPVYWELMEPEENKFDFSLVDGMIADARQHNLKIVFLWFGTWKNSMSCYAPLWMKQNAKRFPRTLDTAARSQEIFSAFGAATLEADKKAFAALMRHTKEIDAVDKTVIMVQVENEIGMLPTSREFSKTADNYFNGKLPTELMSYLQKNKNNLVPELKEKWEKQNFKINDTWKNTFGEGVWTDEIFQAWYYAKFTNEVTVAGKKEYNLPMFVNAALPRLGKLPGQYPSAGPLPQVMDIWQAGAPALDMLSPDFYNPNTKYWCDLYVRNNNTLFVPEMQFDKTCAAKAFFIIGHYKALGFSPFSIESENDASISLSKSYEVIQQLTPFITSKKWLNMDGFLLDKQNKSTIVKMGQYNMVVSHEATLSWSSEAKDSVWSTKGGIILQTAPDEFLVAGSGIVVTFENTDKNIVSNIAAADEISYINGVEVKGRRMNGDQDHQGRHIRFSVSEWGIQKVKLYNSPTKIEN